MTWMGFEPTIPVFERANTVHALGRAATVIGRPHISIVKLWDKRSLDSPHKTIQRMHVETYKT
jgi:hypothetical protein